MSSKKDIENIILVDSSYTTFYRFFATLRWYSFSNKDEYKKYKDDIQIIYTSLNIRNKDKFINAINKI